MDDMEQLKAENKKLREQLEGWRQREFDSLKEQLALAKADVAHFRSEAHRNADVGRRIHTEGQVEINRLREHINALERIPNARAERSA